MNPNSFKITKHTILADIIMNDAQRFVKWLTPGIGANQAYRDLREAGQSKPVAIYAAAGLTGIHGMIYGSAALGVYFASEKLLG